MTSPKFRMQTYWYKYIIHLTQDNEHIGNAVLSSFITRHSFFNNTLKSTELITCLLQTSYFIYATITKKLGLLTIKDFFDD